MTDVLAIISRAAFDRDMGGGEVGTLKAVNAYDGNPKPFRALGGDGSLFLVTARPSDQLWLVAILDSPRRKGDRWVAANENKTPITDITQLIPTLKFVSGTGIKAKAGQLGMSLQTPRGLTEEDARAIRALTTSNGKKGAAHSSTGKTIATTGRRTKTTAAATGATLEEEMAKGETDAFLVYADRLLQEGDARGDLIQIQHQRMQRPKDEKLRKAEKALLAKHREAWVPQTGTPAGKKSVAFKWRLGFFDSITLTAATPSAIRAVIDHPSAQFARELEIEAGFRMMPAVVLALAARPRPSLRSLTLRQGFEGFDDVAPDAKEPSYKSGYASGKHQDRGNALWKALPNLRSLVLKGYQLFGELNHPSLEELTIDGYPICDDEWKAPKLEKLTWEVGDDETGTNTDAASYMVAAIWEGKLPALRRLDLQGCSAIIDDEVLDEEAESGEDVVEDTCAASLLRHKGFVKRLAQLDELILPELDFKTQKQIASWLKATRLGAKRVRV